MGNFWKSIQKFEESPGVDPTNPKALDETGRTYAPLHQAVFWGDLEGLVLLTSRGANVNIKTRQECRVLKVPADSTPLHLAATIGSVILVKQLICDGADENAKDAFQRTPLQVAGTESCRHALTETAVADLKDKQRRFADLIERRDWNRALKLVDDGFPANATLPDPNAPAAEKYHAIQMAATHGTSQHIRSLCARAPFLYRPKATRPLKRWLWPRRPEQL